MGFGIEPCGHNAPLKRIKIGPDRSTAPPLPTSQPQPVYAEHQRRLQEGERIWAITRQTAEGCNAPPRPVPDLQPGADTAPSEILDTSGWDAA
jgi:hypothetical protein